MAGFKGFSTRSLSIAGVAALTIAALPAQAQVITNGSFEASPPNAPGWTSTGAATVSAVGSNLATHGSHVGALGVGGAFDAASGTVYQDFVLSQAGTFSYRFDAGTVFFGGFGFGVGFVFRIDDQVITSSVPSFVSDSVTFSYYPLTTRIAGDVLLSAGTHRFAFDISRDATLFGRGVAFVIDDIETGFVPTAAGAVPEPSTWALLILGFGAVGAGMRRRNALAYA